MNNPKRIGLVGAGWVSTLHMDAMKEHPDRTIPVAICDPSEEAVNKRASDYKISRAYTDLKAMIKDGGLDAAIVCTPSHIRYDVAAPLLDAGIPVLLEKPMSETYEEAAKIAAKSKATGIAAAVNQSFRRGFSFMTALEILKTGECGRPLHLTQVTKKHRSDKGWRLTRHRYVMAVMSIHWFDGYRLLFGEEPETVYCRGLASPLSEGRDETALSATLTFPGGGIACLSESFSSLCGTDAASLDCEKKTIQLNYDNAKVYGPNNEVREVKNTLNNYSSSWYLLNELLTAHDEKREPETSVHDNLNTLRIMEAAYRSMNEKREVRLEEIAHAEARRPRS